MSAASTAPGATATATADTVDWTEIPSGGRDIRLVISDMDGTLLTDEGTVPDAFWPLLEVMRSRGITFVPASGRQYATLARLFGDADTDSDTAISYIAENGNLVVHRGEVLSSATLDDDTVQRVITATRAAARDRDLGLVVCGVESAYVERADAAFVSEARKYYAELAVVDDLTAVSDAVLKLAVYDFVDSQTALDSAFSGVADGQQVVVSGRNWFDIMRPDVDKGRAVRALRAELGVTPAQTAVFGDYLNDLQMLSAGDWSFAMANAHPDIRAAARYLAPSSSDGGVMTVLDRLLGSD